MAVLSVMCLSRVCSIAPPQVLIRRKNRRWAVPEGANNAGEHA